MKFDKIVGFGDSWMYGDELLDPDLAASDPGAHSCWAQNTSYREEHCFLGLLARRYGVPAENLGFPGSSLQSAIWNMLWWLEQEPSPHRCLVLVGLTDAGRTSFYNPKHISRDNDPDWNRHVHSAWIQINNNSISTEWRDMIKNHMVLTDCPILHKLTYQQTTMFFDGVARQQGFSLLQFNIMPAPTQMELSTLPWPDRALRQDLLVHQQDRQQKMVCRFGHPNESGHQYLADVLQKHIDHVILAG